MHQHGPRLTRASSVNYRSSQNKLPEGVTELHRRQPSLASQANGYSNTSALLPTLTPPSSPTIVTPKIFGFPLKYLSLWTLALQNASLAILMHYSRVSTPPSASYSAATAVLINEIIKGSISFAVAFLRTEDSLHGSSFAPFKQQSRDKTPHHFSSLSGLSESYLRRFKSLGQQILSPDCWKLSIPAILYVIQNNLQYVASANLDVVIFQVSYQMKILTTAAFSVLLLRKQLDLTKWIALLFLAIGVGIVQIQTSVSDTPDSPSYQHDPVVEAKYQSSSIVMPATTHTHVMHPLKGFAAVITACFTSGLAGVYFEMVLKGSTADLWVRNVQLSLFSVVPALIPILFGSISVFAMFSHFGIWAWATVLTQVLGGLVTALVIKYSDNILKAFATSLSIIISFLASVWLFNFRITPAFLLGSSIVMLATWLYNQPQQEGGKLGLSIFSKAKTASFPGSPVSPNSPILGQHLDKKRASLVDLSPRAVATALGLSSSSDDLASMKPKTNGYPSEGLNGPFTSTAQASTTFPTNIQYSTGRDGDRFYIR